MLNSGLAKFGLGERRLEAAATLAEKGRSGRLKIFQVRVGLGGIPADEGTRFVID